MSQSAEKLVQAAQDAISAYIDRVTASIALRFQSIEQKIASIHAEAEERTAAKIGQERLSLLDEMDRRVKQSVQETIDLERHKEEQAFELFIKGLEDATV